MRQRVASAASQLWVIDLPALQRLHLGWPIDGIVVALSSLSSASLEVLSLFATDQREVLPTSALSSLPSRCPTLRAMRLEYTLLDRSFPAALALWGLYGHYAQCSLISPLRATDEAPVWATQFM